MRVAGAAKTGVSAWGTTLTLPSPASGRGFLAPNAIALGPGPSCIAAVLRRLISRFLRRRWAAEHGVAVGKATEPRDDVKMALSSARRNGIFSKTHEHPASHKYWVRLPA